MDHRSCPYHQGRNGNQENNGEVVKKTSVHRLNHHYKLVWAGFLLFLCQGQASRMDEINHEGDVLSLLLIYCFL